MSRGKRFSFKKSLEIYLVYSGFKLWTLWVKHLPLESLGFYGEKLGTIAFYLLRWPRRIALNNLHLALGKEKSAEEIKRICLDSFKNIGKDMMLNLRGLEYADSYIKTLARLEGKEYLDRALKQGKGVIVLSAHLGNFPLMIVRLIKEGYPLTIVARESKNPKIIKFLTSFKDAFGIKSIPIKPKITCVARCLRALKENRILMIQIDLNAPVTEAWVDFFGYLVPTFKGPVVFSLRTGAPILPVFTIRNPDSHHKIIIHPPFGLNTTGNSQQDITSNIAQLTKIVEAAVREYPEQWWWARPRFKRARDIHTGESLLPKHP